MDANIARTNMLKQQIHAGGITDSAILTAMSNIERAHFVPKKYDNFAFADLVLPIGAHQRMLPPVQQARILSAISIQSHESVLEIGTGTGYLTALLAQFAHEVTSIEIAPALAERASNNLNEAGITNAHVIPANGAAGYLPDAPYDIIVITGSLIQLPMVFFEQLRPNGRLFCIIGQPPVMQAMVYTKEDDAHWTNKVLFETNIAALRDIAQPDQFAL